MGLQRESNPLVGCEAPAPPHQISCDLTYECAPGYVHDMSKAHSQPKRSWQVLLPCAFWGCTGVLSVPRSLTSLGSPPVY
jgi:hypothetical protein